MKYHFQAPLLWWWCQTLLLISISRPRILILHLRIGASETGLWGNLMTLEECPYTVNDANRWMRTSTQILNEALRRTGAMNSRYRNTRNSTPNATYLLLRRCPFPVHLAIVCCDNVFVNKGWRGAHQLIYVWKGLVLRRRHSKDTPEMPLLNLLLGFPVAKPCKVRLVVQLRDCSCPGSID